MNNLRIIATDYYGMRVQKLFDILSKTGVRDNVLYAVVIVP